LVLLYAGVILLLSHISCLRWLLLLNDILILDWRYLIIRDHLLRLLLLWLLELSSSIKVLLWSIDTLWLLKYLLHLILTILSNLWLHLIGLLHCLQVESIVLALRLLHVALLRLLIVLSHLGIWLLLLLLQRLKYHAMVWRCNLHSILLFLLLSIKLCQ
jgi:hypothetical protein